MLAAWLVWGSAYAQESVPQVTIDQSGAVPIEKMIDSAFQYVDLRQVPSGLLLEHGYSSLDPTPYTGTPGRLDTLRDGAWRRLYVGMARAVLPGMHQTLPELAALDERLQFATRGNVVPLTILHYNYHSIDTNSVRNGLFSLTNGIQLHDLPRRRSPYLARTLFAVAPAPASPTAGEVTLQLQPDLFFINTGQQVNAVVVSYTDPSTGKEVATTYKWSGQETLQIPVSFKAGARRVRLRLSYTDGTQVEGDCVVQVQPSTMAQRYNQFADRIVPVSATRALSGSGLATGTLSIEYGCGNQNRLLKPLLIVEGFDPQQFTQVAGAGAAYTYASFYGQLTVENRDLRDMLDNGGYDLVFLNLNNAGDYIQNNAYLVQAALDWINAEKARNGSTEPNVVLGLSMGGLVARYALRDMELAGRRHQTAKYISFDSPHQGAYIPVGFQYMIKHLAGLRVAGISFIDEIPALRTALELLNLPATRQLLRMQALDFNLFSVNDPTQAFYTFQREYQQMGNPQGFADLPCRSVAISNGSQVGVGQLRKANSSMLQVHQEYLRISGNQNSATTLLAQNASTLGAIGIYVASAALQGVFGVRGNVEFIVNGLANQQQDRVYGGRIKFTVLWFINTTNVRQDINISGAPPIETAPGGYQDFGSYIGSGSFPLTTIQATRFCYIPTVSALDIKAPNNGNLFYNIAANNVVANQQTTFANVTGPDRTLAPVTSARDNDFHLTFTDYNNRLLRAELLPPNFTGNEALTFDGVDDIVAIPYTNSYINELNRPDFAVEAFVRADPSGNPNNYAQTIFSNRRYNSAGSLEGMLLTLYGNEILLQLNGYNYYGSSVGQPVTVPNDGNCHHIAISRGTDYRIRFYLDGQEAAYSPTTSRSPYAGGGLSIGADRMNGFVGEAFKGMIGEVRVWNSSRTTGQIQQTLIAKLPAPQYGLVGYYDMQDASSSQQVSDLSAVDYSGRTLSPGTRGLDASSATDDPSWLTRCELPCTVQGNFRLGTRPLPAAPDTAHISATRRVAAGAEVATTGLTILPNPASQSATLYFTAASGAGVTIRVFSVTGSRALAPQTLSATEAATGRYALPIKSLSSGVYLITVEGPGGTQRTKLQVE